MCRQHVVYLVDWLSRRMLAKIKKYIENGYEQTAHFFFVLKNIVCFLFAETGHLLKEVSSDDASRRCHSQDNLPEKLHLPCTSKSSSGMPLAPNKSVTQPLSNHSFWFSNIMVFMKLISLYLFLVFTIMFQLPTFWSSSGIVLECCWLLFYVYMHFLSHIKKNWTCYRWKVCAYSAQNICQHVWLISYIWIYLSSRMGN